MLLKGTYFPIKPVYFPLGSCLSARLLVFEQKFKLIAILAPGSFLTEGISIRIFRLGLLPFAKIQFGNDGLCNILVVRR